MGKIRNRDALAPYPSLYRVRYLAAPEEHDRSGIKQDNLFDSSQPDLGSRAEAQSDEGSQLTQWAVLVGVRPRLPVELDTLPVHE